MTRACARGTRSTRRRPCPAAGAGSRRARPCPRGAGRARSGRAPTRPARRTKRPYPSGRAVDHSSQPPGDRGGQAAIGLGRARVGCVLEHRPAAARRFGHLHRLGNGWRQHLEPV
ncbi:MAG: hypothetical protein E6G17_07235, partial [Actinobacteria bacterium]